MLKRKAKKLDVKVQNYVKVKLPIFYKFFLTILIFLSLILFYFIVVTSNSPRSINFITSNIQKYLDNNYKNVSIDQSFVNFTKYGSFKIAINDVKILYDDIENIAEKKVESNQKFLVIPRVEAEFSLWQLIFFNFNPKKIKIIKPQIKVDNANLFEANNNKFDNEQIMVLVNFLADLRKNRNPIENFEIEEAKIELINKSAKSSIVKIKNAKILTRLNLDSLDLDIQGLLFFQNVQNESNIDANCKLSNSDGLNCGINIVNLVAKSIADFHPIMDDLNNINSSLSGKIDLIINKNKSLKKILFKLRSDRGSFEFKKFFQEKIDLKKILIEGEFDANSKIFNLSNFKTDLVSNIANQTELISPNLEMSLKIALGENYKSQYDFAIKINNVLADEWYRFWPITLSQNGIRNWVIEHFSGGIMRQGFVKFLINNDSEVSRLENIDAQIDFADLDLNYDASFPEITKLSGIATFTKKDMKIAVKYGEVFSSKISNAEVAINDFLAPINILSIKGNLDGSASDGLKHANDNVDFHKSVDKYLKGKARSYFEILLPLKDLDLKKSYILVKSSIIDLKNDFAEGDIDVVVQKNANNNIFNIKIDLDDAKISDDKFRIYKNIDENSNLVFKLDVEGNNLLKFKDMVLVKENFKNNLKKTSTIRGEIFVATDPLKIEKVKISNKNFNQNNYDLLYEFNQKLADKKLIINGNYLDLSGFLNNKFSNSNFDFLDNIQINIGLNNLLLKNQIILNGFSLNLICKQGLCLSGNLNSIISKSKNNTKVMAIKINPNPKKTDYVIAGKINDVGTLIKGLGYSNLIENGAIDFEIKQLLKDGAISYLGNVNLNSDIAIYEGEKIQKLTNDKLVGQVKKEIFSNNKTVLSSGYLDFNLVNKQLAINSLVANNFKIGFTAKGKIDLVNNQIQLKGMIVPGYIINSLFGITKIPIIGQVIGGLLTGGEGGGIFSIRYEYVKNANQNEGVLKTNKVSAFVPSSISNLFE